MCEHIYKIVNADICPKCGRDTHETNWKQIAEQHKKWVKENPNFKYQWWSI